MIKLIPEIALRPSVILLLLGVLAIGAAGTGWAGAKEDGFDLVTRPLPADYRANRDGSITLRICYNWSCAARATVTFSAADLAVVKDYLSQCAGTSLYDRVQRLRVGIWQLQLIAQRHLPQLANDREINDFDKDVDGRLDCVDSSTNTSTYLRILQDLGQLPGWSVAPAEVRNLLDLHGVHWTAVVINNDGARWSVDSWYRPHGHLPFVMPLADWSNDKKAWVPPYDKVNPYPETIQDLCSAPTQVAAPAEPPQRPTAVATLRR